MSLIHLFRILFTEFIYFSKVTVRELNAVGQTSSTLTLTIQILDANDNDPVFPAAAYETSFQEGTYTFDNFGNQPRNLITVLATDADLSSQFRQISYSITAVSDNAENLFDINQSSGQLTADGTFVGPSTYTVTVKASDGER